MKKRSTTAAGHIPNSLALNRGVLYATFVGGASQLAAFRVEAQSLNAFWFSATGALAALGQAGAPGTAAPCWLVVTPDGKTAFVGNGSGSISSYAIAGNTLTLLDATAALEPPVQAGFDSVAADSWISPDGKFLYTAYLGDDKVVAYAIGLNGSLAKLGETVIGTATKLSLQGLVGF